MSAAYPEDPAARDRWILARRGPRNRLDPKRPYGRIHEQEPDESGRPVSVSTIFLTNRECPWRCLMCDLWSNTLEHSVPAGAIPAQIALALADLPAARWIKLYNAGSFFDPRAIPARDHAAIARSLDSFERIIVESHPALVGASAVSFRDALDGSLEVALGLETIHPDVLPRLNKRMTLDEFRQASEFLAAAGIAVRAFVLVGLPFVSREESVEWACRSIEFAFDRGASVVSLIPTRTGNGAMDELARSGQFSPPDLSTVEAVHAHGLALKRGRVLADTWDIGRFAPCGSCRAERTDRLARMNLAQSIVPGVGCVACEGSAA